MDEQKLTTLELISGIIANSHNLNETLKSIVLLVQSRVKSEVCSIYLLDEYEEILVLKATVGLNQNAINNVNLKKFEGLVGEVVKTKKSVVAAIAKEHPAFKYIPETNEDNVTSFLGVPLLDRGKVIGVLTVQNHDEHKYSKNEIKLLNTIAGQVSLVIVNAKLLAFINSQKDELQKEKDELKKLDKEKRKKLRENIRIKGIPASKGVALGKAHYYRVKIDVNNINEEKGKNIKEEWEKYLNAVEKSKIQLIQLELEIASALSEEEGKIFHTHLMILEDTSFHTKINQQIEDGWNAQSAVKKVICDYIKAFNKIEDEYLKERISDLRDVGNRIIGNLLKKVAIGYDIPEDTILIARELTATEIATLDIKSVKGILLEKGGAISHTSILAKSFGIPVVAGLDGIFEIAKEDDLVAMDGNSANVYINPTSKIIAEYERLEAEFLNIKTLFETKKDVKSQTKDGIPVSIGANVGLISELELAKEYGAEEIGLYRTEFSFSIRENFPNEDEQFKYYSSVLKKFQNGAVTFRILDIGGDKFLPYYRMQKENNPFLGLKSIRLLFNEPEILKYQIKAVLRAGKSGKARIMFPMITNIDEVLKLKIIIEECKNDLEKQNKKYDENMEIGIMIEVPSAAMISSTLAEYVDFFSIGTNDLIQYLLAVDRNNRTVASMYRPLDPAVLRTLKKIIDRGHEAGIWVSMCGEMAGNFLFTPLLIGFGLDKFHMAPSNIPMVKLSALGINLSDAKKIAEDTLNMREPDKIKQFLMENHPLNVEDLTFHEII